MIDIIAFDGDDTLWHNERLYTMARERFRRILSKYDVHESIEKRVNNVELQNLKYYGFGVMSFVLSLIEASIQLTEGRIVSNDVRDLLDLSKEMLDAPVDLFDGAEETLTRLSSFRPLMLITKGDLLHQKAKLERSGLSGSFRYVEVVSDKSQETYASILARLNLHPSRFLMVGNSTRSDILPVLELGGWAVHIPAKLTWSHEKVDVPDRLNERYIKLDHLRELPEFVDRLGDRWRK